MRIQNIRIDKFKQINELNLELGRINFLIGGNNAGKSSALQAIHTAVTAAQSQVESGSVAVLAEQELRYSPTGDFSLLGHHGPFENRQAGRRARVTFSGRSDTDEQSDYYVELYKGRNNRNVGINRGGRVAGFGSHIYSVAPPFTVYVPGLAGIPHNEEYKNEGVVLRKVAGGEANFVLRNILLLIKNRSMSDELSSLIKTVFPKVVIKVEFDSSSYQYIDAAISTNSGQNFNPIDMVGTGVLQAVQIFAYAVLFKPKILLLDEPDAHLHPSNQALLNKTLLTIAERLEVQVILATHSRHLINSAPDESHFFWLENGSIKENGEIDNAKVLLELGALDQADKLLNSQKHVLLLVEDEDSSVFETLVQACGHNPNSIDIVPYFGVTHSDAAAGMMTYLKALLKGDRKVVVHRDRDFMSDQELHQWKTQIEKLGFIPFATSGSDVEWYFTNLDHLALLTNKNVHDVELFVQTCIDEGAESLRKRFKDKRREINRRLHIDGGGPETDILCPPDQPMALRNCTGKDLVKRIRGASHSKLGQQVDPVAVSGFIVAPEFKTILDNCLG